MNNTELSTQLTALFEAKFTAPLNTWCNTFKVIGTPDETPRYSQIYPKYISPSQEGYCLRSTVCPVNYSVDLTADEITLLFRAEERQILWDAWKAYRTQFLITNHKTIKAI
jgi:hypothetical protein